MIFPFIEGDDSRIERLEFIYQSSGFRMWWLYKINPVKASQQMRNGAMGHLSDSSGGPFKCLFMIFLFVLPKSKTYLCIKN